MSSNPRPVKKPKGQGSSASFSATIAPPIMPSYPVDTTSAPDGASMCRDIKGPGAGTSGESGKVRSIPPRC